MGSCSTINIGKLVHLVPMAVSFVKSCVSFPWLYMLKYSLLMDAIQQGPPEKRRERARAKSQRGDDEMYFLLRRLVFTFVIYVLNRERQRADLKHTLLESHAVCVYDVGLFVGR